MNPSDTETYLLLVLADSNLPTGSFVASSGLESYFKHSFDVQEGKRDAAVIAFVRDSLASYARTALPFVAGAHRAVEGLAKSEAPASSFTSDSPSPASDQPFQPDLASTLTTLASLDALCEATMLNHVARRASRAQGVALLTLYAKGLAPPTDGELLGRALDQYKLRVRREEAPGHLPVCWGALTAALGLPLARVVHLHLFLHARGLLSAAVRLNALGPYAAQQLLLHSVRPLVEGEAARKKEDDEETNGKHPSAADATLEDTLDPITGPVNTWPLGEILAARHDLQHSRIFNS
ncbi:UreF-domain-containing protein [Schizophyllum commune]